MAQSNHSDQQNSDAVFETVAELFSLLSTPIRLKIISAQKILDS